MTDVLRLFAIYVGGAHARATIELHDVFFAAAPDIEAAVPALRAQWWGTPSSLHIDAYAEIARVDGYDVRVTSGPRAAARAKLYFVNTGGYAPGEFGEAHAYSFHVGESKPAIWSTARARAGDISQKHQDNFQAIDDAICVNSELAKQNLAVELTPAPGLPNLITIEARYIKLST